MRIIPERFKKLEYLYILIALIWGIVMVFIVPPFQVPDEFAHYYRAASIADGHIFCQNGQLLVPEDRVDLGVELNSASIPFNYDAKYDPQLAKDYSDEESTADTTANPVLCKSNFLGYAFPSAGIFLGQTLGLNELEGFYIGRIFSLVLAVILTALAIKFIPFGKHVVFVLGLLPMTIFLYASYNYDAIIIPALLLFVAYVLFLLDRKQKLRVIDLVVLGLLTFLISSLKMGYQPILLLLVLFYPKIYWNKKWYFIAFLVGALLLCALPFLTFTGSLATETFNNGVVPGDQVSYILHNPFTYFKILVSSSVHSLSYYLQGFIGILGWLDYKLGWYVYLLVLLAGYLFIMIEKKKVDLTAIQRALMLVAFGIIYVLILTSMYAYSTPVGYYGVLGVQGRYFIGAALPAILAVKDFNFAFYFNKYRKYIIYGLVLVLLITIASTIRSTLLRYY